MSSRPRRSAAQRASAAITDLAADRELGGVYSRTRRSLDTRDASSRDRDRSMDRPSSSASADSHHVPATAKGSSRLRQSTNGSPATTRNVISVKTGAPGEAASGKRSLRGNRKRYVESESDEEEEVVEHDVIQVYSGHDADADADADEDEEMEDLGDEDAEGDPDDMDVDAEGEDDDEDAEGEPDDDLSELDSEVGEPNDETVMTTGDGLGDEDAEGDPDDEVDAEGDEIEVAITPADEDEEEDDDDDDDELGSDAGSREETPDFTKMTKRQRARFEDEPQEYMKLSDGERTMRFSKRCTKLLTHAEMCPFTEVQVKKVFTAEELSMRRSEMARRRRNLSDKRNEEVKANGDYQQAAQQAAQQGQPAGRSGRGQRGRGRRGRPPGAPLVRPMGQQQGRLPHLGARRDRRGPDREPLCGRDGTKASSGGLSWGMDWSLWTK
ncbi:hypothetical protein MAPG_10937 [Magnaporthiopsis poae ATCC 64411]|uniref:INO80 complex subunit B-like conserved region domain-containing protein n=1 Tax=Magnaporthiopsis poae (strain ATCC 64411 / 73-15) TaxID=644358 RepID=A0A0C4EDX7_MAGP6|nr:hypothetical protein MAPG_10937 [Magnaporthiopsis poae ATCC 64411]